MNTIAPSSGRSCDSCVPAKLLSRYNLTIKDIFDGYIIQHNLQPVKCFLMVISLPDVLLHKV